VNQQLFFPFRLLLIGKLRLIMRFNSKTQLFPFACEVLVSGVCFFEHQMFFAFIKSDVFCVLHLQAPGMFKCSIKCVCWSTELRDVFRWCITSLCDA